MSMLKHLISVVESSDIVTLYNSETNEDYYMDAEVLYDEDDVFDGIYFGTECIIDESNIHTVKPLPISNGFTIGKNLTVYFYVAPKVPPAPKRLSREDVIQELLNNEDYRGDVALMIVKAFDADSELELRPFREFSAGDGRNSRSN